MAVDTPHEAMLARLRESIGPTVGNPLSPQQEEDAQAQQLAGVLRMLGSQIPPPILDRPGQMTL